MNAVSDLRSYAIQLLGDNIPQVQVAAALGVTESAVAQWMDNIEFKAEVLKRRFEIASKHNKVDNKYDALEEVFLTKLEQLAAFVSKPMEAAMILSKLNNATRRGQSSLDGQNVTKPTVILNMPAVFVQKLEFNANKEVIKAGETELLTIQMNELEKLSETFRPPAKEISHDARSQGTRKTLSSRDITVADL